MNIAAFLGISVIFGAAGTGAAAAAARAENAETREYTPEELSCMSQYYYKRTSESGFYPPKVSCQDLGDGTVSMRSYCLKKSKEKTARFTTLLTHSTRSGQTRREQILFSGKKSI